ncbi:MAG: CPBP family intramembrane metalloprotease [Verrucomicrobiales bacterium]|nr:CPBP family intramembrane metalloprotease [Verrucomicrobiales bacterium]
MRPARPWSLESTFRFLALLPLAVALSGLLIEVARRGAGVPPSHRPAWLMVTGTGVVHVCAMALVAYLVRAHQFSWREAFGLLAPGWPRSWAKALAATVPATLVAWGLLQISTWALDQLGMPQSSQAAVEAVRNAAHTWERALLFLFAVITAPIVEEFIFRGVLWPFLRDRGLRLSGSLGVAVLFGIIHGSLPALASLVFLGLFWIWLYERTGDLTTTMVSHALFNLTNFVWLLMTMESAPA